MVNLKDLNLEVVRMRDGLHGVREVSTINSAQIKALTDEQIQLKKAMIALEKISAGLEKSKMGWKPFMFFFLVVSGVVGGMFWLIYDEQKVFSASQHAYNLDSSIKIANINTYIEELKKKEIIFDN